MVPSLPSQFYSVRGYLFLKDRINPKKIIVYEMECDTCGHTQIDNIPWVSCLRRGCSGKYLIVAENSGGR